MEAFKRKAKELKNKVSAVYLAYMHPDVFWLKKVFFLLIIAYALSPIDLIPDFIPVVGLLDDLIIIPIGIWMAIKMIPKSIWLECVAQAKDGINISKKYKILGAVFVSSIWLILLWQVIIKLME